MNAKTSTLSSSRVVRLASRSNKLVKSKIYSNIRRF
jgi:hypothetical protein